MFWRVGFATVSGGKRKLGKAQSLFSGAFLVMGWGCTYAVSEGWCWLLQERAESKTKLIPADRVILRNDWLALRSRLTVPDVPV